MINQLIDKIVQVDGVSLSLATSRLFRSDPLDLVVYQEQVWNAYRLAQGQPTLGTARAALSAIGAFTGYTPDQTHRWYHFGCSYALDNTRMMQIFARVVQAYRSGETLGIPSQETQRWLDATEALVFNAANPLAAWLSTSAVRGDGENVRRNAYWRLFGLDLAFGNDRNEQAAFPKASAANTNFRPLFEELLHELWQSLANENNSSGVNASDPDRVYRIAQELKFILRSRRQNLNLDREELAAATATGWIDLALQFNSSVVIDLKAEATSASDRLRLIGERVGLPAHSKSAALFAMAKDLSALLQTIEDGLISGPQFAPVLYLDTKPASWAATDPQPIGPAVRRVITEWAAATGKDLKARARPVEVGARQLRAA